MRTANPGKIPLVLHLNLEPHRYQALSRGIMSVFSMVGAGRQRQQNVRAVRDGAEVLIRCRLFDQGREDWNRGLRELRSTVIHKGKLTRLPDGAICLIGLPSVNVRLAGPQLESALKDGLRIVSSSLEIEVDAEGFRRAVSALPASAEVHPLRR
jgi:hypothetical protein